MAKATLTFEDLEGGGVSINMEFADGIIDEHSKAQEAALQAMAETSKFLNIEKIKVFDTDGKENVSMGESLPGRLKSLTRKRWWFW